MKSFIWSFMVLSAAGLLLSLVIHVFGLFGKRPPLGWFAFLLHLGVFVVGFGAVAAYFRLRGLERGNFWKPALQACPGWMKWMPFLFLIYTVANFILFWNELSNVSGKTADEIVAVTLRGFSGHWMFFYSATFVLFYAARQAINVAGVKES